MWEKNFQYVVRLSSDAAAPVSMIRDMPTSSSCTVHVLNDVLVERTLLISL